MTSIYEDRERELCARAIWDNGLLGPLARQTVGLLASMAKTEPSPSLNSDLILKL